MDKIELLDDEGNCVGYLIEGEMYLTTDDGRLVKQEPAPETPGESDTQDTV